MWHMREFSQRTYAYTYGNISLFHDNPDAYSILKVYAAQVALFTLWLREYAS